MRPDHFIYTISGICGHRELLRAIEKRDLALIFEVRQSDFAMLTRKEGGVTPLLHCLRLGKTYNDIAIILTGAFSRWVNDLDGEVPTKATKALATAVRANLKIAINASIAANQTELISSCVRSLLPRRAHELQCTATFRSS